MAKYTIDITPSARKELAKIQHQEAKKLVAAIYKLPSNPFPPGYKKLRANENKYRIRVGNYRVIYAIENQVLIILILKIGHRKDIY